MPLCALLGLMQLGFYNISIFVKLVYVVLDLLTLVFYVFIVFVFFFSYLWLVVRSRISLKQKFGTLQFLNVLLRLSESIYFQRLGRNSLVVSSFIL